jgi:hypothetical protein
MRRLRLAVIGSLAFLLVVRLAVAATAINPVSHGWGSAQPPLLLLAAASGQNKLTTSAHAARTTFQNFGHNVVNGAKGVGHRFEGMGHQVGSGAKGFGQSVVQGWQSFKRNFTGQ